jgi:chaperonin GroEL
MIKDNLFTGDEARKRLMKGVQKAAEAVAVTLGTGGANSVIECMESPNHFISNDGATILSRIHFEDPLEEMGRRILYEAVGRANKSSGDGSSTATVLTAAILEEGMKHIGEVAPMEIKRSLEACLPLIEKSINEQKREITCETVGDVASISAEDESIGAMIQEIYQKIGKDGIINWEASKTPKDSYEIGTGIKMEGAKCASPYMHDLTESGFLNKATLENPFVLLAKRKITSTTELDNLFKALWEKEIKEIVVFCDEMEAPVINALIQARSKIGFRAVVVKMPIIFNDEWWEDLSMATGGRLISHSSGVMMRDVQISDLGKCGHIIIDREDTFIDGICDISKHILALKVDGTDEALNRAARLNTQTARYFVGAQSESALKYKILKVEDAINAAGCALEHGVVAGGGVALWDVSGNFQDHKTIGEEILDSALERPIQQITKNAGIEMDSIEIGEGRGYDSKSGKVVDMFEAKIIDPADVVLAAAKNAIGVAASILTCSTVVTLPREENPQ